MVEADVGVVLKLRPCNRQCLLRRIDAVQQANAWRETRRPAARPAAAVESLRVRGQFVKREDPEIAVEQLAIFRANQAGLVIGGPFPAEALDGGLIQILGFGLALQSIPRFQSSGDSPLDLAGQMLLGLAAL